MLRSVIPRLRRLTYWQCSWIGLALLMAISAVELYRQTKQARIFRKLTGQVYIRSTEHGPQWLRAKVPTWVNQWVLTTPDSVLLRADNKNIDEILSDLRHLPSLHSLTVWETIPIEQKERQVELIGRLTQLESLEIKCANLDEGSLRILSGLPRLRTLHLKGRIDPRAYPAFLQMRHLEEIELASTDINDDALSFLAKLSHLNSLDVSFTKITDRGLKHFENHAGLRSLTLKETNVTDQGMQSVCTLVKLQILNLRQTSVGDAGVELLARLPQLEQLDLDHTNITDAAIHDLSQIPMLRSLGMLDTKVTNAGFMEYVKACPEVMIRLPRDW